MTNGKFQGRSRSNSKNWTSTDLEKLAQPPTSCSTNTAWTLARRPQQQQQRPRFFQVRHIVQQQAAVPRPTAGLALSLLQRTIVPLLAQKCHGCRPPLTKLAAMVLDVMFVDLRDHTCTHCPQGSLFCLLQARLT